MALSLSVRRASALPAEVPDSQALRRPCLRGLGGWPHRPLSAPLAWRPYVNDAWRGVVARCCRGGGGGGAGGMRAWQSGRLDPWGSSSSDAWFKQVRMSEREAASHRGAPARKHTHAHRRTHMVCMAAQCLPRARRHGFTSNLHAFTHTRGGLWPAALFRCGGAGSAQAPALVFSAARALRFPCGVCARVRGRR